MLYLLAILFPPLAVLLVRKPVQAVVNLGLWCLLILPAIIHAFMVVHEYKQDKRFSKLLQ